jgi:hypothetical protein
LPTQTNDKKNNDSLSLNNLTAIANCLGMDTSKAKRKRDGPKNSFFKEVNNMNMNMNKAQSHRNNLSCINHSFNNSTTNLNTNMNKILPTMESKRSLSKNSIHTSAKKFSLNKSNSSRKNSKDRDNSCFIIFQKSNAKKLKKEIEKFPQNSCNFSENSIFVTDDINFSKIDEINDKNDKNNLFKNKKKKFISENENDNFFETFNNFNQEKFIIPSVNPDMNKNNLKTSLENNSGSGSVNALNIHSSTEEESIKSNLKSSNFNNFNLLKKKLISEDEFGIREWLMTLGIKECCNIDFSKEEILEFQDGIFLSNLVAKLENKKIVGINPNPRSSSSMIKNIVKSLEILRNKKVKKFLKK